MFSTLYPFLPLLPNSVTEEMHLSNVAALVIDAGMTLPEFQRLERFKKQAATLRAPRKEGRKSNSLSVSEVGMTTCRLFINTALGQINFKKAPAIIV